MRGFPKHINTEQDLINVADQFPQESLAYQQQLMDGRFIWQDAGMVGDEETISESATSKVVENKNESGIIERHKLVLVEDGSAQFFSLGLSVAGVEEVRAALTVEPGVMDSPDPAPSTAEMERS